ncbi:cytochrome c maturation protein CcmE [Sansalvadorimonas sp. 2012CJ34-2]|uniref:Cytochrome c-type biogenesis protein CcmE n=1 Tax=Parendozoicomonas callyspongiae TaxID=2942213 RepID=A0ABT0PMG9_9GAMM|nr:cytochrome c maturation protein CcmE [Sansalvadorimonas sp. 2012CJ34-2]MCL6271663.1 cytochrome c maturation protein CcmE [Sansalvadorimonas sp. 2012CJ34-2]
MTIVQRQRFYVLMFILCGVSISLTMALVALQSNINLFFTPSQMIAGEAPIGKTIRGGGLVVPGSVERSSQNLKVRFGITDGGEQISVRYEGILPDLFQEGQGIVALGQLEQSGEFCASEVLAKHDPNYMPPEVKDAIDKVHAEKGINRP